MTIFWNLQNEFCHDEIWMCGFIVKCGLLLMWFHLLTSIYVFENKIVSLANGVWQSVLDCTDRFVAVFNLSDQSASWLESAAD